LLLSPELFEKLVGSHLLLAVDLKVMELGFLEVDLGSEGRFRRALQGLGGDGGQMDFFREFGDFG
jgi:hypothetical protein